MKSDTKRPVSDPENQASGKQKKQARPGKPGLSVGNRIAVYFIGVTILSMVLIMALNFLFLEKFYRHQKIHDLYESFEMINKTAPETTDDISDEFEHYCMTNNISVLLTDSELSDVIYTNVLDGNKLQTLVFGMLTGNEQDHTSTINSGDNYQMQIYRDGFVDAEYLQLIGQMDNGDTYLARIPLESIRDSVKTSNTFYCILGILTSIGGGLAILYLTRRVVRPLEELTEISKKMAALDFDTRYTSGGTDEIGQLGEHFNVMSETLEKTITELKQANVRLQADIEEKTQIDEMRREFLGNVTHELKTPIALIQGYAEGLKDNISDDPESREFYCDVIIDESARMNNMVKQILALNQLESGRDEITMERFDIIEVISGVLKQSSVLLEQSGADVRFDTNQHYAVWGDEFKVEQVLTNYLTNAIHHLSGEHVISINCRREDAKVRVTVFNTGDPIPEDSLEKVWIKFYKVDKARTRAYGGSGIGLSIVKAICDSLHQTCGCQNYDNGVAFWFTLDDAGARKELLEAEEHEMPEEAESEHVDSKAANPKKGNMIETVRNGQASKEADPTESGLEREGSKESF